MSKHTPGPWHVSEGNIRPNLVYAANGYLVADCNTRQAESDSNAGLVAAAPDFLAVALAYERWEADVVLSDAAWKGGMSKFPTLTAELYDRLIEIQAMRNGAVAKAEGK